ncbi:MAG TPA: DNA internalization-related competence protein ComEC/Rec2 [Gammaproteobacteria bacterium]|nr:DNA internalization-related competence protein ComEC/Rec2 [Gammaproteobacteria bacterium]
MQRLPALPAPAWLVPGVILALLALERPSRHYALTALLTFAWTVTAARGRLDDWLPAAVSGRDFTVSGWVDGFPAGEPARKTFTFRVRRPADPAVPRRLRLAWYDAPALLEPGAELALRVRLRRPRGLVNPGGFDYEQWLLTQGIGATGYVREGRAALGFPSLGREWLRLRARIAARIEAAAPTPSSASLLVALTIGERYGFTQREWTDLQRSGLSHLVAISGSHVALVALLVFAAVRRLCLRLPGPLPARDLEIAGFASLAAAAGYAALAGFGVPIQRSVVMIAIATAVLVSRRTVRSSDALAAAALAVVAWDPFAAASASFWLSFGAVALLLALGARREVGAAAPFAGIGGRRIDWRARGREAGRFARTLGRLQLGMSFGSIPIAAVYFARVSLISPVSNLVAIPYFTFVLVPLALAGALGAAAGIPGANAVLRVGAVLADWAWAGIHAAAAPAWASVPAPGASSWALALACVGAAAALPAHPLPGRSLAWCALLPVLLPSSHRPAPGAARLEVLDVGHGLAVIVETHAHRLLYDAGPRSVSGFDAGREIVVPVLELDARAGLDALVVSHSDADHAGGAGAVLARYPRAHVLAGPDVAMPAAEVCESGRRWTWDDVEFRVLHPPRSFSPLGNDSSCVLKVIASGGSVLLAGDIEARAEALLASRADLAADVVVVPHHGSATSSTRAFVDGTGAREALVSAAFESRWGFPRPDVVARWRAAGARVSVTGAMGALTVTLDRRGVAVSGLRAEAKRYWRTFSESAPGTARNRAL